MSSAKGDHKKKDDAATSSSSSSQTHHHHISLNPNREMLATMLAGPLAGMCARVLVHPLDTCKAKIQVNFGRSGNMQSPIRSVASALSVTLEKEGVMGLYRGMGICLVGAIPASCLYFALYEGCKNRLMTIHPAMEKASFVSHFVAGFAAEAGSCVFWVPVDVVKERLQVQSSVPGMRHRYKGSAHALATIFKEEGVRGMYRGYGATLASFGPFSALYFVFYEKLKALALKTPSQHTTEEENPEKFLSSGTSLVVAGTAGAAASFCTSPLDMAKLRLQVQRGSRDVLEFQYRHTVHALSEIVKQEGFLALFRGSGARMLFHAPTTAITLSLYEKFKSLMLQ